MTWDMAGEPYNPLDKLNLAESIKNRILERTPVPLSDTDGITGAGIYLIYYVGSFGAYAPLTAANADDQFALPIYVGKAIPKGGRKGGLTKDSSLGTPLADRLRQHASSIDEAKNLDLADFQFRHLVVEDIWIPLGENMLIETFKPAWNVAIDGFGNKDPGRRRATQYKSPWDVLHEGRKFAEKLADSGVSPDFLAERVGDHLEGRKLKPLPKKAKEAVEDAEVDEAIDETVDDED